MTGLSIACDPMVDRPLHVPEALQAMATAVRSGDMVKARTIGERCVVPLNLTAAELAMSGKVSEGAESTVFRGHWRGREVAVKKVRIATSADLDRFRRELDLLAGLHHPAVVPLLGARALPPDYMIVLPLAAGGNVRHAVYELGWRPSWRQLLGLAYTVAAGMQHVHEAGILHRDLKPANLLLLESPEALQQQQLQQQQRKRLLREGSEVNDGTSSLVEVSMHEAEAEAAGVGAAAAAAAAADDDDEAGWRRLGERLQGGVVPLRVQIADFGIAVRADGPSGVDPGVNGQESSAHAAAKSGKPSGGFYKRQMVGTLEYMAPELLLRTAPASRASDVYAWAVTMNELATGVVPFSDCTKDNPEVHTVLEMGYGRLELAAAVCAEGLRPLLPRSCPPAFAALMGACWRADPAERPDFAQVLREVEALAANLPQWEAAQQHAAASAAVAVKLNGPHQQPVVISATAVDDTDPGVVTPPTGDDGAAATPMDVCEETNNRDTGATATAAPQPPPSTIHQQPAAGSGAVPLPAPTVVLPPFVLCSDDDEDDAVHGTACNGNANGNGAANGQGTFAAQLQAESVALAAAANGHGNGTDNGNGHQADEPGRIFQAGMFEAIGPRDSMEDRCVLLPEVHVAPGNGSSSSDATGSSSSSNSGVTLPLVALFDGHRGSEAAEFCRARLADTLWAEARACSSPVAALRRTFLRLETEYHALWQQHQQQHQRRGGSGPTAYPGTTALAVLLAPGGRLLVANAGDCRAVVCRRRRALAGSRDHTGLLEDERWRLQSAGTAVTWQHGGWRIGASGLQVTRCIGDFDVKGGAPGTDPAAGVTASPEITCLQLTPDDHFVVLGTDGLWDVVSAQEAVGLVYDTVKEPTLAAKRLVTEALMRGSADNVTSVVVFLSRLTSIERVYEAHAGEAYEVTGTAYGSRVRLAKDRHVTASADELRDTY